GSENVMIVRGTVESTGAVLQGVGFTADHPATGLYNLYFTPNFGGVPTVTMTTTENGAQAIGYMFAASTPARGHVAVTTKSPGGSVVDARFNFIAVGPK